jgi:hypothetical protein
MKFSKKDFRKFNLENLHLDKERENQDKMYESIEFVSVPSKKKGKLGK